MQCAFEIMRLYVNSDVIFFCEGLACGGYSESHLCILMETYICTFFLLKVVLFLSNSEFCHDCSVNKQSCLEVLKAKSPKGIVCECCPNPSHPGCEYARLYPLLTPMDVGIAEDRASAAN